MFDHERAILFKTERFLLQERNQYKDKIVNKSTQWGRGQRTKSLAPGV